MIPALLGKEIHQHGAAFLAALLMVLSILACLWFVALYEDHVTLLGAAYQTAAYVLPALVLFVDGRLVVRDHDQGTHEFLAALPIGPISRTLVRFGLGLLLIEGTLLSVLLATAILASRREGVPIDWMVQLGTQLGLYLAAWHGLAFGVAHLGSFRWLAWWTLLVSWVGIDAVAERPASTVYWFGLVVDGPDRTRLDPPWDAVPLAILWGLLGLGLGLFLASFRGGALLERAFRPITGEERARRIGAGVALMLGVSALADQAPRTDGWVILPLVPSETAVLRVAASPGDPLWEVGAGAAAALDGLGAEIGVRSWPPVVLLRSRAEAGRRAVRPAPSEESERSRVLLVDPAHPVDDLVRRVVSEALVHRLARLSRWDADARWIADGAAGWWLGTDPGLLGRRAALGAGTARLAAEDWYAAVARLGPDVASGVAWAGLLALERELGRQAVLDRLRAVLGPERQTRWPDGLLLRRATRGDWTGLPRERWIAAWEAALAQQARASDPGAVPPLPSLSLLVEDGAVLARWDGPVPPGTALELAVVDPLQQGWLPDDPTEVMALPEEGRELQLRVDVRSRVLAQLVREEPAISGQVSTGWGASR